MSQPLVVADASVLVNFLRIDRMDIIEAFPGSFIVTEDVAAEITYPDQKNRYETALSRGCLVEHVINDPVEVSEFLRLDLKYGKYLGKGELSAIAVALNRSCLIAIDDNRAVRNTLSEIGISDEFNRIIRTQDIVVESIRGNILTLEQAESIRTDWETNHRFKLRVSFKELLYGVSRAE